MGERIEWNGIIREVVKVKSDNPDHAGFYTTFRDAMVEGDEEYCDSEAGEIEGEPGEGEQIPPAEPIKQKKGNRS